MTTLIFDPLYEGHHLDWANLAIRSCAPFADRIVFATTGAARHSQHFQIHLGILPRNTVIDYDMVPVAFDNAPLSSLRVSVIAWDELERAIARYAPDHVIVPTADLLLQGALLKTARNDSFPSVDAVFLVGAYAYAGLPLRRRIRAQFELLSLRRAPFSRVLFVDPIVHSWILRNEPTLASRCVLAPDPVSPVATYSKVHARRALGLVGDGRVIACVGVLDRRKGADGLIAAFVASRTRPNDRLLLAGSASEDIVSAAHRAVGELGAGRLILLNRLLSNDEFALAISAADVVAVPYRFPDHIGSASLLIRAAAAGRPVLAAEAGWPGHVTERFGLGWLYPNDERRRPASIADALARSSDYQAPPAADAFVSFHSRAAFSNIISEPLRERRRSGRACG